MHKKGISEVISWVLLIGVTVVLATTIGVWMKQQAEQANEYILQEDYLCNDVSFSATLSDCNEPDITLTIKNTGSFTIQEFIIRQNGELTRNGLNIKEENRLLTLKPGESITQPAEDLNIDQPAADTRLELTPLYKETTCTERKIIITCPST
ncbi:MAG TPA: archaellin/type IV pilin N-terminal domain-containing protein [Candidatus Nanoarchaeia archaeon]|nr:archaellin/type IV pilin N-terminal domain-containing protein [Candidatus Nanoarchaeia archaeon]